MNRRWLILAAVVVAIAQIGFLVSMITERAMVLRDGEEIVLSVEPVDPRDLLRGDYVTLSYNISRLPRSLFTESAPEPAPENGDRDDNVAVFVRLKADADGIFQPIAARFIEKPGAALSSGEIDIRGQTKARWSTGTGPLFVNYGIERFYVPEGEGKEIERNLRQRSFRMRVVVDSAGTAQIRSFHDGEKMLFPEPIF